MKILQITSGQDANDATRHCMTLAEDLTERGHEVTVACRPNAWIADRAAQAGLATHLTDLRCWPLAEVRCTARYAMEQGVELIHTHMSRAHTFGILLRFATGVPCVATAHSRRIQWHWMFNDLVIAISEKARRFHETYNLVRPDRIVSAGPALACPEQPDGSTASQTAGIEIALSQVVKRRRAA